MEIGLDVSLNKLKTDFATMCRQVENALENANNVVVKRDATLAKHIVDADKDIDEAEMDIERGCMRLLLRNNPFATDFRDISCILKAITDVERIADQAADIAGIACTLSSNVHLPLLEEMGKLASVMVSGSVQSIINKNATLADRTEKLDDEMDILFDKACSEIAAMLKADVSLANEIVQLLMIAKYYERIGDHSVNICEWTQYSNTGVHSKYQ